MISDCDNVKINLLQLLTKKMETMQIVGKCHEYMAEKYNFRGKIIAYTGILSVSLSFIMSAVYGENTGKTNLPLTIISGISLLIKGTQQYCEYDSKALLHAQYGASALDLVDDIEYIILKNNHTKESLQKELDIFEERIKGFRKNEITIPSEVKEKFSKN